MADKTKIEWTEATWNPITGCTVHSAGCTNCYAMKLAGTRLQHHPSRAGLTKPSKAGPVWTGEVRFNEEWLKQPLKWKKPRMIFVCAHGDLFHEDVPDEWIDHIFAVMALCPQHTFQVLTKRSARMREYFNAWYEDWSRVDAIWEQNHRILDAGFKWPEGKEMEWPLSNVWLGVSVESNQHRDRIIDLSQTSAALRWISGEPLLDEISLTDIPLNGGLDEHGIQWLFNALTGEQYFIDDLGKRGSGDGPVMECLDWVVAGGESGQGARPMHPGWVCSLRDQCAAAGTPYFFKQWGQWAPSDEPLANAKGWRVIDGQGYSSVGKKAAGRLLDGVLHDGMPI